MPLFLETWMDRTSDLCMFSAPQLKTSIGTHLEGMAWYLYYVLEYIHADERALKSSAEGADEPSLLGGNLEKLDGEAESKLIAKLDVEDKNLLKITAYEQKVVAREQA